MQGPVRIQDLRPWPWLPALASAAVVALVALILVLGTGQDPARGQAVVLASGLSLQEASVLEVSTGGAVVNLGQGTNVVLESESRLIVMSLKPRRKRLRLDRGRAVFQVAQQEPGTTFGVETSFGVVHVVGTLFDIRVQAAYIEIRVAEGTVRFDSGQGGSVDLKAGQKLRHPDGPAVLGPRPGQAARLQPELSPKTVRPDRRHALRSPGIKRLPSPRASVSELLKRARKLRANKKWGKVARAYRQLIRVHPLAPEAQTSLVLLGQVELKRHKAINALRAFRRYLSDNAGGSLAEEASWGEIMALHSLDRPAEETRACRRYLRQYPDGTYARPVRSHLEATLQAR